MAKTEAPKDAEGRFEVEAVPSIVAASCEDTVLQHWPKIWKAAGFSQDTLKAEWETKVSEFLKKTQASDLQPQTFVVRSVNNECTLLGSIQCQIWAGPIPWVVQPSVFRLGTVWGPFVEEETTPPALAGRIRKELLQAALMHLRSAQCSKVVTLAPTPTERDNIIEAGVGFQQANMLTLDLKKEVSWKEEFHGESDQKIPFLCREVDAEHDATVCSHWRLMWLDVGIPQEALIPDMENVTMSFIQEARNRLNYQTFLARCAQTQKVVGSVSCQIWDGPFPKIVKPQYFQLGTIWAVYVHPDYRRQGIATALMKLALQHLEDVGCDCAILIAASMGGQCVYERLGFRANNALVCDLQQQQQQSQPTTTTNEGGTAKNCEVTEEKKQEEESPTVSAETIHQELRRALSGFFLEEDGSSIMDDYQLKALRTATTQQLMAVYGDHPHGMEILEAVTNIQKKLGLFIDPQDNWFTQRLAKAKATAFGGGFDMKQLSSDPSVLASKFDRLANRYDHWTVGNRSKVESFIVRCATTSSGILSQGVAGFRVLDVACGIGLQGQVLRMFGFRGELVGTDISSGMVRRVKERGCYNHAYVSNANQSLRDVNEEDSQLYDVVICTGAMELLDQETVLGQISKMTKPGGKLWVSFQHEDEDGMAEKKKKNPTQHQNVKGISQKQAISLLHQAGFHEQIVEVCPDAFYTPSPEQDGTLLAVPYLFILAKKEG